MRCLVIYYVLFPVVYQISRCQVEIAKCHEPRRRSEKLRDLARRCDVAERQRCENRSKTAPERCFVASFRTFFDEKKTGSRANESQVADAPGAKLGKKGGDEADHRVPILALLVLGALANDFYNLFIL